MNTLQFCLFHTLLILTLGPHGGLKFGPLPPLSRDGICMQKQVWPTDFLPKIYDNVINSLQIRKFGPYLNSSNMQVEWTKAANSNSLWSRDIKSVLIYNFGPS